MDLQYPAKPEHLALPGLAGTIKWFSPMHVRPGPDHKQVGFQVDEAVCIWGIDM